MAVKMTLLPKLLFLFRSLPINIPKSCNDKLQQDINRCIWQNKRPRFSKRILYKSQTTGGLGPPNLWFYFLATRFSQIAQWNIPDSKIPWVKFEAKTARPYCLMSMLWSPSNFTHRLSSLNSIVSQSLTLWHRYKSKLTLISPASPGSSFLGDPLFATAFNHPESFAWWKSNSLITLADLQISFQLSIKQHWLRIFQVIPYKEINGRLIVMNNLPRRTGIPC